MICSNCGENEANFKYTEIINGTKKEITLCEKCANKLGLNEMDFNMPIDFSSFFGDFLNEYENNNFMPVFDKKEELKCDICNMTYDEFLEKGKFGCSNCYNVFDSKIEPLVKRLHGGTKHLGRQSQTIKLENIPKEVNIKNNTTKSTNTQTKENIKGTSKTETEQLKQKLKEAIKVENYEEAAKLRDQIKTIEQGG